jgi:transcriptional regulator with PAS, ATPase and Fis domain
LAEHFLAKYAHEFERCARGLSEAAMRKLIFYDWPGNIRELENTIERAVMLTETECIFDSEIFLADVENCGEDESFQKIKAKDQRPKANLNSEIMAAPFLFRGLSRYNEHTC